MSVPYQMLLYPELMTNQQLIEAIQERYLRIPNLENMRRDDLLNIFNNFCVPYGQRRYRDTGRGKVLNRSRPKSPITPTKFNTIQVTENWKSNELHTHDTRERLKPPPDLLSGHMKRIKLESKPVVHSDINNDEFICKRKMSIEYLFQATESPSPKKERKAIMWP